MNDDAVAVIGGGAAGIAAARTLTARGIDCVLLEASGRLGGRAHTVTVEGLPLDLGCGWLHSADRNPWVAQVAAMGLTLDRTPPPWRSQALDLGFSREDQQAAHEAFAAFETRLLAEPESDRASDSLDPASPWNAYIEAISGYINGVGTACLSARDFAAYENAATETNWRVREGYGTLVARAAAGLTVKLDCPVSAVDHHGTRVRVTTSQGVLDVRAAIVAVPSNVLAAGAIAFGPALDDKLHAAAQLPLGHAEKLFLALDDPAALPPETQLIGNPHSAVTGGYHLRPFGRPYVEGLFGGVGADAIEADGERDAYAFAVDELAALIGSAIRPKLRPLALSRWSADTLIGGGYSHALPGHSEARARLAEPVDGRLFFAGEATSATDFSTCHGAYQSGVTAAMQV